MRTFLASLLHSTSFRAFSSPVSPAVIFSSVCCYLTPLPLLLPIVSSYHSLIPICLPFPLLSLFSLILYLLRHPSSSTLTSPTLSLSPFSFSLSLSFSPPSPSYSPSSSPSPSPSPIPSSFRPLSVSMHHSHSAADTLYKIFKKKIKRSNIGADDDDDEEEDEEDDMVR